MREKILSLLGLMRRASAIALGEDQSADLIRAGKGKLLLLAEDVSENAARRAENTCTGRNIEMVRLHFGREELGKALGVGGCSMAAVSDLGFATALMGLLASQWPEEYGEAAQRVELRKEKAVRRKAQKGKKIVGTRRTNV
ncbi:MAG: ribosomal L7Ae/L30e/S12e/Gadd45 family protein [Oscillospiraceae bacterium]|nr:ribosomal L7Ae/L30e/S12e/Gadd45 family protein [Oscillospiraceae bacterium]